MSVQDSEKGNLCRCGCGQYAGFSKQHVKSRGIRKGDPLDYVLRHRFRGASHPTWNNGRSKNSKGYTMIAAPGHSRADKKGYVLEHLIVAEKALGRPIAAPHVVHHIDGNRMNNKSDNLVICQDQSYHLLLHKRERALKAGGFVDLLSCHYCKLHDSPSAMYVSKNGRQHYHLKCLYKRRAERNVSRGM